MLSKIFIGLSALGLAACASNSENFAATTGNNGGAANITKQAVETCWVQAGLNGDLYKFMSPGQALGLRTVGGSSDAQVEQFKACLVA